MMIAIDALGTVNWDLHPDGTRVVVLVADGPTVPATADRRVVKSTGTS